MASEEDSTFRTTLNQVFELWVTPEVQRRQAAGTLPKPFGFRCAQVVMNVGAGAPEVRLNDEVKAVMLGKPRRKDLKKGDAVYWDDLSSIDGIELTDADPNAGHVTIIRHEGKWFMQF